MGEVGPSAWRQKAGHVCLGNSGPTILVQELLGSIQILPPCCWADAFFLHDGAFQALL